MLYVFPVVIPPNTPAVSPVTLDMPMTAGEITRMMIQFPAGHLGLTHIHINDGLHQVWPSNERADFSTSDEIITWLEEYTLDAAPYTLTAWAWNIDDTYVHTITVRIELTPAQAQTNLLGQVKSLLGMGGG